MNIRAFECVRTHSEIPITVFGRTVHDAETIYQKWASKHDEDSPQDLAMIFPYGEARLAARPLLDAAAAQGIAGVGYWDAKRGAWNITDPSDHPRGDLAPPETSSSYYEVVSERDDKAMVIAPSFEQGAKLFVQWHCDRWGEEPQWFSIQKRSRWDLSGDYATLRDGLIAGMIGVAGIDNDGIWRILPPDWEPIYGRE